MANRNQPEIDVNHKVKEAFARMKADDYFTSNGAFFFYRWCITFKLKNSADITNPPFDIIGISYNPEAGLYEIILLRHNIWVYIDELGYENGRPQVRTTVEEMIDEMKKLIEFSMLSMGG